MFSFNSKIRYSELDSKLNFPFTSLINYFQDCSTFHSESVGRGFEYLGSRNRVWYVVSWQVHINKKPALGQDVIISTWPHKHDKLYAERNFVMKSEDNELLGYANSIWVLMDTSNGRPTKIEETDVEPFGEAEALPMKYIGRKLSIPKELTMLDAFPVTRFNIDTNNHVNNGQYIMMAEALLEPDFKYDSMHVDYRRSALLGDTIYPGICYEDDKCTIVLADNNNKPFTIITFFTQEGTNA